MAKWPHEKLSPKFFGPYQIVERLGSMANRLDLQMESSIHRVFHMSQLKQAVGDSIVIQTHPPALSDEVEWVTIY